MKWFKIQPFLSLTLQHQVCHSTGLISDYIKGRHRPLCSWPVAWKLSIWFQSPGWHNCLQVREVKVHPSCSHLSLLTSAILAQMSTLLKLYLKMMTTWFGLVGEYKSPFNKLSPHFFIKIYLRANEKNFFTCANQLIQKRLFFPLTVTVLSQFYEIVF